MPTYRDEAVVLRTHKLGEADRIITMLSRHRGKLRAVAKGVRRTTSKFGARLEPFSHVDLQFAVGRTLDVVTQVESLDAFGEPLTGNYPAYTAGQVMLETADRLVVEENEPAVQQYLLLVGALRVLDRGTSDGPRPATMILDSYLLRALAVAGYAPSFFDCARCGLAGPHRAFSPRRAVWSASGADRPARRGRHPRRCTCWALCSRAAGPTPGPCRVRSRRRRAGSPPHSWPGTWTGPCARWPMSSVDPRWGPPTGAPVSIAAPPAPPPHRPHRVAYVFAVVMPLILLAVAGHAARRGLGSAHSAAEPRRPALPVPNATKGERGLGDPYYPEAGNSGYDVAKYQISVSWDPASATLTGTTTITARANQPLESFYLDLALPTTRGPGERTTAPRSSRRASPTSRSSPPPRSPPAADFSVVVDYAGRPGDLDGDVKPFHTTNAEWSALGEPESSAWWFPANDHPSDPALMDVSVRVPAGMEAISVGRLESADTADEKDFDTWHWVSRKPMATYLNFVSIGQFELKQGTEDGLPYVYAVSEQLSPDRAQDGLRRPADLRPPGAGPRDACSGPTRSPRSVVWCPPTIYRSAGWRPRPGRCTTPVPS